jgi:hypothetical protein
VKRTETFGLRFGQLLFEYTVYSASARAFVQRLAKFSQILGLARCNNLNMAVIGVAHPAVQAEFGGFAMDEPAEPNSLNTAFNHVVANHKT